MSKNIIPIKEHLPHFNDIRDLCAEYFKKYPDSTAGILILFDNEGKMLVKPCRCPMSWMAWAAADLLKQSVSEGLD